jgi:hypothetical protein
MKFTRVRSVFFAAAFPYLVALCPFDAVHAQQPAASASVTAQEAYEIGVEAYVYFYPLVSADVTRRKLTNIESGKIQGLCCEDQAPSPGRNRI